MQAYNDMDRLARQALAAICRSCHVRLRCDTFSAILDDYPMQPGSVSSSALQYLQYMNNFSLRQAVGDKWTLTMSQEGVVNKGLVTVIGVNDTRQGISPNVCKLQVTLRLDLHCLYLLASKHSASAGEHVARMDIRCMYMSIYLALTRDLTRVLGIPECSEF